MSDDVKSYLSKTAKQCDFTGAEDRASFKFTMGLGPDAPGEISRTIDVREKKNGKLEGTYTATDFNVESKFDFNDKRVLDDVRTQAKSLLKSCHAVADHLSDFSKGAAGSKAEATVAPAKAPAP